MAVEIPAAASSIAVERVSPKTVQQAVNSLLKWRNSKSQIEKPKLFDQDDEFFYLILTLKKIPPKARVKPHKVLLPNSLAFEFSENLLIIDDGPKSNLTKEDVQKKIKAENIPVSKVLKLSKLKANYRPFEAKRKLCDSYTMFFSDKKVIPLLPRLLGKHFFKKKKIPVPLDLTHKNWKEQIEKANSSALLFLRTGTCCVVKVAKVSMEEDEIVANVVAAINGIVEVVPKKWGNVRSFHLKMFDSLALPLYQTVPDLKLKIEGAKLEEDAEKEAKDIAKNEAKKGLKVGKKRGRIHAVRYMDNNVDEEPSQDEFGDEDDGVTEEEDNEKDEMSGGELVDKKKKKRVKMDKGALSELNSVKELKKARKSKDNSVKHGLSAKRKKENVLPSEDAESGKKKMKRSGVVKPDGGNMKVKAKKK
ncbi:ribosomal L1 domain-containing protein 1-like [Senna tora]|uniref:Ribosomal L1 domain-containing protein 1-like n=1 Tax=Senna tora TaxID=362788 RepID=A0A834T3Q2_9FABA|nr:ribosomal L1 domain-containing protein 1-like [Senna tora]